jgi:hypothetical protein
MIKNQKAITAANRQMAFGGGLLIGGGLVAGVLGLVSYKAIKAASDMEIYQNQFHVLMRKTGEDSRALFNDVTRFAAETPFNIPEVVAAGKNLLAFGIAAKDVKNQLKLAGDWSSVFNRSLEWTSTVVGRLATGSFGRIYPALRSMGIRVNELGQYGAPMTKDGIIQKGADPKKVLEALNKYISAHFLGGMEAKMATIPGRISNIQDKIILTLAATGRAITKTVFGVVKGIEEALDPSKIEAFATALGQGLNLLILGLKWVLTPLGLLVKGIISLSNSHPGIVKWGIAMLGAAAATMILTGAFIALAAVHKLIVLSQAGAMWKAWRLQIVALLPAIGWIALGVFALAMAFRSGDKTVMQTLRYWYQNITLIAGGVFELFSTIDNGVGYLSKGMADKLQAAGLLETVKSLFMVGYRVYQILAGAFQTFSAVMSAVGWVLGKVIWVVSGMISVVMSLAGWLGLLGSKTPVNTFKIFGNILGIVVAWMLLYKTYVMLSAGWTVVFTGIIPKIISVMVTLAGALKGFSISAAVAKVATWAFNAALWANPVVWIIGAVLALIGALVLLVTHFDKVKAASQGMPDWVAILVPQIGALLLFIKYWDKLALTVSLSSQIAKSSWNSAMQSIADVIHQTILLTSRMIEGLFKLLPKWMLPGNLKTLAVDPLGYHALVQYDQVWKQSQKYQPLPGANAGGQLIDEMNKVLQDIAMFQDAVAKSRPPITVPVYLDGKQIGKAVAKYDREEHDSGR